MKPLLLLLILTLPWSLVAQPETEILETALDISASDVDTICGARGQFLRIPTDTFYIINAIAVDDFRRCRVSYAELHTELAKIEDLNHMLTDMETDFDSLMLNMHTLETQYGNSLANSIRNAETMMSQNTTLQNNLNAALNELSDAKNKIKSERWNKLGTKMLWATGGLVAGILIISVTD